MKTILTLTGCSGSGKSVLESMLVATGLFDRIVSHTTRLPRPGEVENHAYHFVERDHMLEMISRGEFVEHAEYGKHPVTGRPNIYGTSEAEFQRIFDVNKSAVVVVEPNGRDNLRKIAQERGWGIVSVFVDCPVTLQVDRLVTRAFDAINTSPASADPALKELKTRMINAVQLEPGWREKAYADKEKKLHEIVVPLFDPSTEKSVIEAVISECNRVAAARRDRDITPPATNSERYTFARYADNNYEVSSKGDSRFSALFARLSDGRTIEQAYQLDVKGYRVQGDDWKLGKGKPAINGKSAEELWTGYVDLWRQWSTENPLLIRELAEKAQGRVLTDMFATSPVSQARALAQILNEMDLSAATVAIPERRGFKSMRRS